MQLRKNVKNYCIFLKYNYSIFQNKETLKQTWLTMRAIQKPIIEVHGPFSSAADIILAQQHGDAEVRRSVGLEKGLSPRFVEADSVLFKLIDTSTSRKPFDILKSGDQDVFRIDETTYALPAKMRSKTVILSNIGNKTTVEVKELVP